MKATFLFPGQGAQNVGMGAELVKEFPTARKRFDQANEILGRDIAGLCFEGPEDNLKATQNTQPALFTVEAAVADVLVERGLTPVYTAGHSLGEYNALYAAGVFGFEEGLKLVARRGELMARAGEKRPGTMAAIIGLDMARIAEVLEGIDSGVVVPANQNSPQQTVISGEVEAVKTACERLKEAGAKRALVLGVSGAFHSPLMEEAAQEFGGVLADIAFSAPRCPVIANVTAQAETDGARLKELLTKQLVSPVRWVDTIATLSGLDYGTCLETGPGAVLKGLSAKCNRELKVIGCGTAENIYSLDSSQ